jgi:hypothetical protein
MSKNDEANPHEEPCLGCGEEIAVGSVFFSDRHVVGGSDGPRAFLCSACVARIRAAGHHEELEELTDVKTVGELAMIGLNLGGTH